ncbi:MAG: KUP/HAK/KT family potassium transporter [Muribaculaceae bacterium]|nr:KUP/HAK/KT family potassium transporter [Muribaculaceae bacterium]
MKSNIRKLSAMGLLVTMGIVFGDIGTSPLYVMKAIVGVTPDFDSLYIIGAISCVIWTLTLQTTLKYVIIALRADNKGEGGILSLYSLLRHTPPKWLYIIAAIGASALIADGVITPAVTVTSAVEGLSIVRDGIPVVPIVAFIIIGIFVMQQAGTGRIGKFFGPFMLVWFMFLGVMGALNIGDSPDVLKAFNPWYALRLLIDYPGWFLILGAVFLCTTGAEALYSDLGHCGRMNISMSWIFVKIMLILNYLGQGAWLLSSGKDAERINPFYGIMPDGWIIPAVILSTGAAIIASQALLSGSFTIFSEAISLNFFPRLKVKYPSDEKGQLYIPAVNWTLLAGCLLTVVLFKTSSAMETAYGLAITVTMLMTTVLLTVYLRNKGVSKWICGLFLVAYSLLEGVFFIANASKFIHGGWYTLLIAGIVGVAMVIWRNATKMRRSFIDYRRLADYADVITELSKENDIPRYASNVVYFSHSRERGEVESKLIYSILNKEPKRADHYWIITPEFTDDPYMLEYDVDILVPDTLYEVHMRIGFRVEPRMTLYLRQIVEDLVADGDLDLTSRIPSLRKHGLAGNFRFIVIHRVFSASSECGRRAAMLMQLHSIMRRLSVSDETAMGLDTSNVTVETVPLIINTRTSRRIRRGMSKN